MVKRICETCKKVFYIRLSKVKDGIAKNCSKKCQYKSVGRQRLGKFKKDAGYMAIHNWVRRNFGIPSKCENCGTTESKIFDWANISGKYSRERKDWIRLCRKCHNIYDHVAEKASITRRNKINLERRRIIIV